MKLEMMWGGGSGISWTMCKSLALHSRQITVTAVHHSTLHVPDALLAALPNSVKALKVQQKRFGCVQINSNDF